MLKPSFRQLTSSSSIQQFALHGMMQRKLSCWEILPVAQKQKQSLCRKLSNPHLCLLLRATSLQPDAGWLLEQIAQLTDELISACCASVIYKEQRDT